MNFTFNLQLRLRLPLILGSIFLSSLTQGESKLTSGIPLKEKTGWQVLEFSKLPANQVQFGPEGLRVKVNKSSSPLIYPLKKATPVFGFSAKGKLLSGNLKVTKPGIQGNKQNDDFIFKMGLVQKGTETLSWFKRQVAASWIVKLFDLAPKGTGIKNIRFFNVVQFKGDLGKKRTHPLSHLIKEEFLALASPENGEFILQKKFEQPIETLALWLSLDGDETQSEFEVQLTSIELVDSP